AELGVHSLGKISASGPGGVVSIKSNLGDLSVLGSFPIADKFSAFGRLGGDYADTHVSGVATGKKKTTNLMYGAGLRYDFTPTIGVRAEWEHYNNIGARNDATGIEGAADVDVFGVSLVIRF